MQAGLPTAILRGGRIVWLEKRPVRGSRAARAGGTRQKHQNYFFWPVVFNKYPAVFPGATISQRMPGYQQPSIEWRLETEW